MTGEELNILSKIKVRPVEEQRDYLLEQNMLLTGKIATLEKENAELKCECRRCVYTDSPCILSDYGKDKNGICDHFKDVFDENAELKERNRGLDAMLTGESLISNERKEQLTKAKEIIKDMLSILPKENIEGIYEITEEAEQFLKDVGKVK